MCSAHAGKAGRPTVIDAALREQFMAALATGVGVGVAAAFAGIGRSTAHGWLARGEKEAAAGVTAETSEFVAFLDGVTRTRASVHVRLAAAITSAASGDWRAAAWMLERLAPEEFGKHRITQPEQHTYAGGSVVDELLGGRQPVDIPLKTRKAIVALLRESEAEATAGETEEL